MTETCINKNINSLVGKTVIGIEGIESKPTRPLSGFEELTIKFSDGTALRVYASCNHDSLEGYMNLYLEEV